jgi:hypothetical protein
VYFEKKRPIENRLNGSHCGVESFDVAHLQYPVLSPSRFKECIRFRKIHGHGLFYKHVQPALEELATHFGMRHSRHRHTDRLRELADFVETSQNLCLKLGCDSFRAR